MAEDLSADTLADESDVVAWEGCLDAAIEMSLEDSLKPMEGLEYYHGSTKSYKNFKMAAMKAELDDCVIWAEEEKAKGTELARQLAHISIQKQATGRAWTRNASYPICSVMRKKGRSIADTVPAQPFLKNFYRFLHSLPEETFIVNTDLFRAEYGVRSTWDEKVKVGNTLEFYEPRSFSTDAAVMRQFFNEKDGVRTLTHIKNGWAYNLTKVSFYGTESEAVTEGVMRLLITKAEKYDAAHPLVASGEVKSGLHYIEGVQVPGIEMLTGSPVRRLEREAALASAPEKAEAVKPFVVNINLEMKTPVEGLFGGLKYMIKATGEFVTSDYIMENDLAKGEWEKISDAAARARGEIKDFADRAKARKEDVGNEIEQIEKDIAKLKANKDSTQTSINEQFQKMEAVIEEWRIRMTKAAQDSFTTRCEALNAQRKAAKGFGEKVDTAIEASEQALAEEDDKVVILVKSRIEELMPKDDGNVREQGYISTFMSLTPENLDLQKLDEFVASVTLAEVEPRHLLLMDKPRRVPYLEPAPDRLQGMRK